MGRRVCRIGRRESYGMAGKKELARQVRGLA
jgi:hypothetical protein